MPDGVEVDPDLVGPPGLQPDLQQGRVAQRFERLVVGHGGFPAGDHRPLVVVGGMPVDGRVDRATGRVGMTLGERVVDLVDPSFLERAFQDGVGMLGLGHDHQAARPDVEPVDDSLAFGDPGRRDPKAGRREVADDGRPAPAR